MPLSYSLVIALSAGLAIAGHYQSFDWLHWVFKPTTTLLIAAWVWRQPVLEPLYRRMILIGLLFSCGGDIFLMLPGDWFVAGLASFLLAHLCYLWALRSRSPWFAPAWPVLIYAVVAAPIVWQLWPHLPPALRLPVMLYVLTLAAMAAQAASVWWQRRQQASLLAALGAAVFVSSDAMLAWNRFVEPFDLARLLILLSYWLAQWLIAQSVQLSSPADARPRPGQS